MNILVIGLASLIVVVILGALLGGKGKKPKEELNLKDEDNLPYKAVFSILTKSEKQFFHELHQNIDTTKYNISCKVRLLDLLFVPNVPKRQSYLQRVWSKHVDFVISDIQTMKPRLVIELDDSSHNRQDRKDRDAFVDKVLNQAELPILHIQLSANYANALQQIKEYFN